VLGTLAACTASTSGRESALGSGSTLPSGVGSPAGASAPNRRWPGEWEQHDATLMSMPFKEVIYGRRVADAQREWAGVAKAIARFEPVKVIIPPGSSRQMRGLIGSEVRLIEIAYDDGWLRDNGPIFVTGSDGFRTGLDWGFNGWGGAFDKFGQTWHKDDLLPTPLLKDLGIPREGVPMILEGGSVQSDGNGTILTTAECLLNPDRNPSMNKAQIEAMLVQRFGARKVIWLPFGLIGDLTSGHVDGVAMWISPGRVIAQTDPENTAEQERLAENLALLRASTDADGKPLDVVEFPMLPRGSFMGLPAASFTYLNFGFTNGGVVVPVTGDAKQDREGLGILREIITDREIVGVPAATINWAGGGVHCITQQLPAA
jgi:agmatine deiminase